LRIENIELRMMRDAGCSMLDCRVGKNRNTKREIQMFKKDSYFQACCQTQISAFEIAAATFGGLAMT